MDENKKQLNDKNIKVLRTYTSDMADAIRTNEISVIKIALAEKEKREQEAVYKKAEGTTFSKIFLVIGGIILIVGAMVGSYFLFKKKKEIMLPQPQTNNTNVETFISYEKKSDIDVTNVNDAIELNKLIKQNSTILQDQLTTIFLKKKIDGVEQIIISKDFFNLIDSTAPGALIRSLSDNFLIGKYLSPKIDPTKEQSQLFLVFQTNNYGQTYASMLDWEKTMLNDLKNLFEIDLPIQNGSDAIVIEKKWKDIIINNRDIRVVYGDNGEGILYYVFINNKNLVIATNLETINEVIERLIIKN